MEKDWIGFELHRPSVWSSEAASFIAFCSTDLASRMLLREPFAGNLSQDGRNFETESRFRITCSSEISSLFQNNEQFEISQLFWRKKTDPRPLFEWRNGRGRVINVPNDVWFLSLGRWWSSCLQYSSLFNRDWNMNPRMATDALFLRGLALEQDLFQNSPVLQNEWVFWNKYVL
jgi:hypothetical protein